MEKFLPSVMWGDAKQIWLLLAQRMPENGDQSWFKNKKCLAPRARSYTWYHIQYTWYCTFNIGLVVWVDSESASKNLCGARSLKCVLVALTRAQWGKRSSRVTKNTWPPGYWSMVSLMCSFYFRHSYEWEANVKISKLSEKFNEVCPLSCARSLLVRFDFRLWE